jgi:tRNA A-37 threonylcarbamoyl transferase component Bud32
MLNKAQDNPPPDVTGKVHFADDQTRALLRGHLEELSQPRPPTWQRVKYNASRTVYRGRLEGREIYLKHFHGQSLFHRLGRMVGFSRARYEMHFAQYLRSRDLLAVPPLATVCHNGVEWLATLAISPAEVCDAWHIRQLSRGPTGAAAIRRGCLAMAETIARMHEIGVIHCDLHCGNILVQANSTAFQLVLTDLHRMKRRRRLSRRAKAANLALLLHDRRDLTTRTERLRFLKHYLACTGAAGTLCGWITLISDFARRHTRRQHSQRDRRVVGLNRYFAPLSLPGRWRGHVILASKWRPPGSAAAGIEFTVEQWREALANPQALLDGRDAQVVKSSDSGTVVRCRLVGGGHDLDVYVKRPRRKRRWKIILDCFRTSRPLHAFRTGHELLTRGIATAMPLAALERRFGPLLLDSILITETVHGPHLNQFLQPRLARLADPQLADLSEEQQRKLAHDALTNLGHMVQRLHDNNFAHRDLKSVNILVHWQTSARPQAVLIDLDGLWRLRKISARRRFRGLMRLNVSLLACTSINHSGRLRMLLGYLRRPGCGKIRFKSYWRVLERWSAGKLRQQIRSRRKHQRVLGRNAP